MGEEIELESRNCTSPSTTYIYYIANFEGYGQISRNVKDSHSYRDTEPVEIHGGVPSTTWTSKFNNSSTSSCSSRTALPDKDIDVIGEVDFDNKCSQLYFSHENVEKSPKLQPPAPTWSLSHPSKTLLMKCPLSQKRSYSYMLEFFHSWDSHHPVFSFISELLYLLED